MLPSPLNSKNKEKKTEGDGFWKDYEQALVQLDNKEVRIRELESENENLKANQKILFSSGLDMDAVEDTQVTSEANISTVDDAVRVASKKCSRVEFLDSAYTSAAKS